MGGVGCDNMSVVLACFLHRDGYGDLVYRCSRDSNKVSRSRRFSSVDTTDPHKMRNRERRMSEPPPLTKSPIITSKLTAVADSLFPNGLTCDVPTLKEDNEVEHGEAERRRGSEGEGEGEEHLEDCEPLETTL